MKFHIVGNGESVREILESYDLTLDELKKENRHIRIWNYLIPGTKLKIPVLSENINQDINEMEPFIEDYYPKIKVEDNIFKLKEEDIEADDFCESEDSNHLEDNISIENDIVEEINENEMDTKIKETIEPKPKIKRDKILIGYVFPQPYYYRPIIYVIPRRK